jgi:DNA-binding MarR family transcriptional regulator
VERAPSNSSDGRTIRVLLTAQGWRAAHEFAEQVSRELEDLLKDLSPTQRERFAAQAAQIVAASGVSASLEPPRPSLSRRHSKPRA